jgi:HEAT repeat protein
MMEAFQARLRAIAELGRSQDPAAVPALVELLSDRSLRPGPLGTTLSVRRAAHDALVAQGERALPALREALRAGAPDGVDCEIVRILAEMRGPASQQALIESLHRVGASPPSLWVAAGALGQGESEGAEPALASLLDHPHPDVVRSALWALGRLGSCAPETRARIRARLEDPETRTRAAIALGRLGEASVTELLLSLLAENTEDDGTTASELAGALARLGESARELG